MSYDTYLEIDTGGEHPATVAEIGNYTSNVSGMWTKALGHSINELDGETASLCIPVLERALANFRDPDTRHEYIAMNPSNKWGNVEGAQDYLEKILTACKEHPKAKIRMSY